MPANLLEIKNLSVVFPSPDGASTTAVGDVSFALQPGETLGIVGESGSGKSVTAFSILGLLPPPGRLASGEIIFQAPEKSQVDLAKLSQKALRQFRGREIAMIFQEPATSLNPLFRCGEQVAEAIRLHKKVSKNAARQQVLALFERVRLPEPERMFRSFPHQISGGQRQRVMIAMALACNPSLLIADEPTSSLDVTVQRAILDLLKEMKNDWGGSTIFISHDLGVVAEMADRVLVMQNGQVVEQGETAAIFSNPQHAYTLKLLENYRLRMSGGDAKLGDNNSTHIVQKLPPPAPVICVLNLSTWFPARRNFFGKAIEHVKAVDEVSFEVMPGETLGVVGESGSGKTTLGRTLLGLLKPTAGQVFYHDKNLTQLPENEWKTLRRELQIIFQDPWNSLNPRLSIGAAIAEPMRVHGILPTQKERHERTLELLETVGLEAKHFHRFPHEFSGGQRQRLCIARALASQPKFIVCDECVSSLDVTVQTQVLDLLMKLKEEKGLTYVFISHDLSVVRLVSDRVAVMQAGKIVEMGRVGEVFFQPKTEYTRLLLAAIAAKL